MRAADGFRHRPGVSLHELADMLAAIAEGLAIRYLGDSTAAIAGDNTTGNLVGMAILGVLNTASTRRPLAARRDHPAFWFYRGHPGAPGKAPYSRWLTASDPLQHAERRECSSMIFAGPGLTSGPGVAGW
jgi:hypothetical protein